MAAHNDPVILVASDNKSTSEIVQTQLSEFDRLIIPDDLEGILHAYRKHNPDVIILGYDQLDKCEQIYDRLYPKDKDQNPAQKPHRVIALCNKREVRQAYDLCNTDRFTDYIVFWPLTYDPYRLAMSVHQSMTDLRHNFNAQENDRVLVRQQQNIGKLQRVFEQQSEEGQGYSQQVDTQLSSLIHLLSETLNHYDHLVNRVLDQAAAGTAGLPSQQAFSSVRGGIEHSVSSFRDIRQLSRTFIDSLNRMEQEAGTILVNRRIHNGHVLVVDDDDFQRQVLSSILTSEHYSVSFATSGEAALDVIQHKRPDLILMDILMPGMDGIEATRQIKTDPVMSAVPIIIISGQNQRETVLECIAKGASDYIVKPYNKATLISKIQDAVKAGNRQTVREHSHDQA